MIKMVASSILVLLLLVYGFCNDTESVFATGQETLFDGEGGSEISHTRSIKEENNLPGTKDWMSTKVSNGAIQGYASKISANRGEQVDLYISTREAGVRYNIDVYRLGFYQGMGGRLLAHIGIFEGEAQGWWNSMEGPHNLEIPDSETRLIDLHWNKTTSINIGNDWVSGYYIFKLVTEYGDLAYIPIIVRDDDVVHDLLVKAPVLTWQAYNAWGGASLYGHFNDKNVWVSRNYDDFANHVSFNRPLRWDSGVLLYDLNSISWLEKEGYDLGYFTDLDLPDYADKMNIVKGVLSVGHDEYWTKDMRDSFEGSIENGINIAFLGSNAAYWQVRLEADLEGRPKRIVVCYKIAIKDPIFETQPDLTTTRWRELPVNRPENGMIGIMYDAVNEPQYQDWVVANPDHWVFEGLSIHKGDRIPNLVGNEYDSISDNGKTPKSIEVISESPVFNIRKEKKLAHSTIYTAESGSLVFATGTLWWGYGLTNIVKDKHFEPSEVIQKVTQNVLTKFLNK